MKSKVIIKISLTGAFLAVLWDKSFLHKKGLEGDK